MRAIDRVPSGWILSAVGIALLVALIALRRWRHLFTFFVGLVVVEVIGGIIYETFTRPPALRRDDHRPLGRVLDAGGAGRRGGAVRHRHHLLARARRPMLDSIAKVRRAAARSAVFAFAAMYLGKFHPSDIAVGVGISTAVLVNAFRFFTPNETFPVTYKRGKTAHLDVGGRRGEAIRRAVHDQLGLTVLDVRPIGLAGSGGSTPLLITVAGDPETEAVREALRHEPRPRRPLVQARPDGAVRAPRGRGARTTRCAGSCSTRTTRCA